MQEQFVFSGFGGQGVMFVGQLLAYAAMNEGFEVTWIPSYGPEMRGGTAHCYVIVSDRPIGSPLVRRPRTGVVFNNPSFDKYEPLVAAGGLLVRNASLIAKASQRTDITELAVPATSLADELGELKLTNVIMLGATLTALPVIPLDAIQQALDEHMPAHRRELIDLNFRALDRGAAFAAQALKDKAPIGA